MRINKDGKNTDVPVCYKAFIALRGITGRRLVTLKTSLATTGKAHTETRVKHGNRPHQLKGEILSKICQHIQSLRVHTKKRFDAQWITFPTRDHVYLETWDLSIREQGVKYPMTGGKRLRILGGNHCKLPQTLNFIYLKIILNGHFGIALAFYARGCGFDPGPDRWHLSVFKCDRFKNIKSRRLRWAGHVARMGESRNAYRVLVGRPEGKRPLGRPRRRWEDNIKMDLREVGYDDRDWINLAQDRDRWRAYVRAAMNLRERWWCTTFDHKLCTNMPELNPKSLHSAYEEKAYVTVDSDLSVGWGSAGDVEPDLLSAIRQE
ncbi:hypothetical protein ANN_08782 [Periplaneta americana]|uniref:Uncharacterized protein n=1 Tax=Periplaneta americana TaxID=6978 RepID=A0ABQ8T2C5_PERAM|nr:hypothetical protein ANN_08782 [Periplaneta americana]